MSVMGISFCPLPSAFCLAALGGLTAQLPMAKAGILKFEILPLMPYTGLESLFAKAK
ncbi:MAG: hypothetical protein PUP92_25480 [Rhizonema sp. PD38]|nr:hypothetical protein [Rhizonema sp. PD38]